MRRRNICKVDLRFPSRSYTHANALWLQVLIQAIEDTDKVDYECPILHRQETERQAAQDALQFLSDEDRYRPILAAAGLQPRWAIEQIRRAGYQRDAGINLHRLRRDITP